MFWRSESAEKLRKFTGRTLPFLVEEGAEIFIFLAQLLPLHGALRVCMIGNYRIITASMSAVGERMGGMGGIAAVVLVIVVAIVIIAVIIMLIMLIMIMIMIMIILIIIVPILAIGVGIRGTAVIAVRGKGITTMRPAAALIITASATVAIRKDAESNSSFFLVINIDITNIVTLLSFSFPLTVRTSTASGRHERIPCRGRYWCRY